MEDNKRAKVSSLGHGRWLRGFGLGLLFKQQASIRSGSSRGLAYNWVGVSPCPLLKGGEPLRAPSATPAAEDGVSDMLKSAHERSIVHHELFQEAMGAMNRLGEELVDVDARLMAEGLRLAEERHKLKVAINLGCHQCELDNAKAEVSLATSREACSRALEEA